MLTVLLKWPSHANSQTTSTPTCKDSIFLPSAYNNIYVTWKHRCLHILSVMLINLVTFKRVNTVFVFQCKWTSRDSIQDYPVLEKMNFSQHNTNFEFKIKMQMKCLRSLERMEDQWLKDTSLFFIQVVFAETVHDSAIILCVCRWLDALLCKDTWAYGFCSSGLLLKQGSHTVIYVRMFSE